MRPMGASRTITRRRHHAFVQCFSLNSPDGRTCYAEQLFTHSAYNRRRSGLYLVRFVSALDFNPAIADSCEYAGKDLTRVLPSRETNALSVSSQGSGRICTLPIRERRGSNSGVGPMRGSLGQVVNLTVAGAMVYSYTNTPKSYVLDRWF